MTTMQLEVYEAFRAIDIPDDKAAKVAAALSTAFGKGNPDHETKIGSVEKDIGTIKTDITSVKADVTTLRTDVSTIKTDVTELKTDVTALKTDVTALKLDSVSIRGELSTLRWMVGFNMTLTLLGFGSVLGFLWHFVR